MFSKHEPSLAKDSQHETPSFGKQPHRLVAHSVENLHLASTRNLSHFNSWLSTPTWLPMAGLKSPWVAETFTWVGIYVEGARKG